MTNRVIKLLIFCYLLLSFTSIAGAWQRSSNCVEGNGEFAEQQRTLIDYQRVAIQGAYAIFITAGEDYRCTINGDSNLLDHVVTRVDNQQLRIGNDMSLCMKQPLQIHLQLPEFTAFYAEGAHEIVLDQLSGANFKLELEGASLAEMRGGVEHLEIEISGTSTLDARELKAAKIMVEAAGTTVVKVQVSEALQVSASGIAEVLYLGSPATVDSKLSGLAEVAPL
ncbi:MAG: DUF2807 domain-containing protein [Desulfuromonas sp.]|nr:DUF2807 domain-containing protein [Desulfuromonas sp.]